MIKDPTRPQLTGKEEQQIAAMMRGQKTEYRLRQRATIIWRLVEQHRTVTEVAAELQISAKTVRKWYDRFLKARVPGLKDAPRAGAPWHFTVTQRCQVVAIACDKPENYGGKGQTLWTYDTLTETVNETVEGLTMSRSSVVRTLTAAGLKSHKTQMWLHRPDPRFREKVNAIVDLYLT